MKEFSDYGDWVQNSTIKGFVCFAVPEELVFGRKVCIRFAVP
jgi:hypothetical protein